MKPIRIIHVEDNANDQMLVTALLESQFSLEMLVVQNEADLRHALQTAQADLIISDFSLPGYNGRDALRIAASIAPTVPFVFFSGTIEETLAIDLLTNGATDYVLKHRPEKLIRAVERAIREKEERLSRLEAESTLRSREEWFRSITENALDIVAALDFDGQFKYLSPSAERVLGWAVDSLLGTRLSNLVHPAELESLGKFLGAIAEQPENTTRSETHRIRHCNGEWRQVEMLGKRLQTRDQTGIVINARDVTDRNNAESRYRTVFEKALEGICQIDESGRLLAANGSLARMLGYNDAESLLGHRPLLGLASSDLQQFQRGMLERGFVEDHQAQLNTRDGRIVSLRFGVTVAHDPHGRNLFNCFIQDITRQLAAEGEVRQQATLIDEAHDAIIVADAFGRIRRWNKGAEALYGWSRSEAVGQLCENLLFGEGGDWPEGSSEQLLSSGKWEGQIDQNTKDGRTITVLSRRTVLRGADGEPQAFLILNSDITEQKRIEANLMRAQRLESIGALAGGVAHDLNNVLAPVLLGCDALLTEIQSPSAQELLETVRSSARRGSEMVQQILTFARGTTAAPRLTEPATLITEVVGLLQHSFPGTISIQTQIAPDLSPLSINPTEFHQILMNLCVNARDAMPEGGQLTIAASSAEVTPAQVTAHPHVKAGSFLRLAVRDTGTGIPLEAQKKIFEPFFTTKPEGKGTGLGLATVMTLVKNLKGFLEIDTLVGAGTTFIIYLPTAHGESSDAKAAKRPTVSGSGQTILFVDDEESIIQFGTLILQNANYRVLCATNGMEALDLIESDEHCDLIITDVSMPHMSGIELIQRLHETNRAVPVICATGGLNPYEKNALDTLPVTATLPKPYSARQLLESVSAILQPK